MKFLVSLVGGWGLVFGLQAAVLEAIPSYAVDSAFGGYVPGGAGFAFSPQTNMAITALGFNGSGLNSGPYTVSLWANGQQLASAVVNLTSTFLNQTYYQSIPAIQLVRGQTYHLRATATNDYWVGNLIQTIFPSQTFSVSSNIVYQGSAYGTNSAGEFPLGTGVPGEYYVAPNFQYQIGGGTNLIWASTSSGEWDIGISFNWVNSANNLPDRFFNNESVLFDDRVGVMTNINIGPGFAVIPLVMTNNSGTNNFVVSGAGRISGTAILLKDGASTLTLATTNDFTGNVVVLGGTLRIGALGALGATNGATLITNSATLDLNGISLGAEALIVSGAGVSNLGAIVNNGPPQTTAIQRLTLTGHTALGGSNRWDLGGNGPASLLTGGQPWNITKVGTNQVSLVGVSQIDAALGDLDIQRGTLSLQSVTAQLGNPNATISVRSNATLSFNNLSATPLNKRIVIADGGGVHNEQGPSVVSGPVTLTGTNSFFVSTAGSSPTLRFTGSLAGTGSLWKIGGGTLVLSASNSYTGSTLVNTGTVALSGSGAIAGSSAIFLSAGTALDVSARSDGRLTLATNQVLGGDGTVLGSLTAGPGSTVSPGTSSLGLLAVTNDILLQGTTFMKLNKAAATNDVLQSGSNLTYGATLSLTNLGGTLALGDRFKLFSAAAYSGAFTNIMPATISPGLAWDTSLLTSNGTLGVSRGSPVITNINYAGTNLIVRGTNGLPTTSYYVLTATNLALPLTNWARITTNLFDLAGNFIFTNSFNATVPQQFYLLQLP